MSERLPKVNELIQQQLAAILSRDFETPEGVLITITRVTVSRDLRFAKVYVSVLPDEQSEKVITLISRATPSLQASLGEAIVLRSTPKLRFFSDTTPREAADIDTLLNSLEY
jgi:ribosome-binding factor A